MRQKWRPNKRLQPTAFGAGMRGASCQQSLWLSERVLPESAAGEAERYAAKETAMWKLSIGTHLVFVLLSTCLVVASLWIPTTVHDRSDMKSIQLGYPIRFVIQDVSRYDPPSFPWQYRIVSPWENPTKLKPLALLGSLLIALALLELAAIALKRAKRNLFQT